jgi:nucleotidyltransferase substrate binding protein (TIGR01987 family)
MSPQDIRWKQRFQNFEKTLHYLEEAMKINNPDIIQRAGLIQFFEMSFELAWNTLKDYLEEQGFIDIKSPRAAIKKAFETGLVADGHGWLKALEDRNLTSHTYDENTANQVVEMIRNSYYPLLAALDNELKVRG